MQKLVVGNKQRILRGREMNKTELVQRIGNDVCGDCGEYSDCDITPEDCDRIISAKRLVDIYIAEVEK